MITWPWPHASFHFQTGTMNSRVVVFFFAFFLILIIFSIEKRVDFVDKHVVFGIICDMDNKLYSSFQNFIDNLQ